MALRSARISASVAPNLGQLLLLSKVQFLTLDMILPYPRLGGPPVSELVEQIWQPDASYGRGRRDAKPFRYFAYVPDPIADFDLSMRASLAARIEAATKAAAELDASPGIDELEPISRLLLRAESVASSRIEGLRVSHRRLEEAIVAPKAARGMALAVVRNIEAMAKAVEFGTRRRDLRVDDLRAIHATIMRSDSGRTPGAIRTEQNWIGGGVTPRTAQFIPPPHDRVPHLLDDLIEFCNRDDLSAVTQAAVAHVQFETIHPFADGNGRTGRCLIHVILRRRGISQRVVPPVSVVLAANSARYVSGLTAFREGDTSEWLSTFAEAMDVAGRRAVSLGESLVELRQEWLERARVPRRGSTARRLIDGLTGHPLVSVESAAKLLAVSDEAARLALNQLSDLNVVQQVTIGRRNRAWAAEEVFDLLDEFDFGMAAPDGGKAARPAPTRHRRSRG